MLQLLPEIICNCCLIRLNLLLYRVGDAYDEEFISCQMLKYPTPSLKLITLEAADQEQAIRTAVREFAITNPEHQKRLVAQRAE